MVWESYPVHAGLALLVLFVLVYGMLTTWIARRINRNKDFLLKSAGRAVAVFLLWHYISWHLWKIFLLSAALERCLFYQ